MKQALPLVSVVIPSKNEEKNIGNCLEGIKFQTYPAENIETIVVVNEDSVDKTKDIAKKYTKNIFVKGTERSEPRNFGLNIAKGKYLIYLDADMILSPRMVEKSVEKMESENIVALYVPEIVLGTSYWSRVRRFERSFYDGTVIDCARVISKSAFEKTGGFDTKLIGPEDWDFDKKLKEVGKINVLSSYDFKSIDNRLTQNKFNIKNLFRMIDLAVVFHNESNFNIKKYLNKKKYYSKSFSKYFEKWGYKDKDIKKQFGFWYRYLGVFLENGKWKKIISFPDLAIGMFFLRFLTGLVFLYSKLK